MTEWGKPAVQKINLCSKLGADFRLSAQTTIQVELCHNYIWFGVWALEKTTLFSISACWFAELLSLSWIDSCGNKQLLGARVWKLHKQNVNIKYLTPLPSMENFHPLWSHEVFAGRVLCRPVPNSTSTWNLFDTWYLIPDQNLHYHNCSTPTIGMWYVVCWLITHRFIRFQQRLSHPLQ